MPPDVFDNEGELIATGFSAVPGDRIIDPLEEEDTLSGVGESTIMIEASQDAIVGGLQDDELLKYRFFLAGTPDSYIDFYMPRNDARLDELIGVVIPPSSGGDTGDVWTRTTTGADWFPTSAVASRGIFYFGNAVMTSPTTIDLESLSGLTDPPQWGTILLGAMPADLPRNDNPLHISVEGVSRGPLITQTQEEITTKSLPPHGVITLLYARFPGGAISGSYALTGPLPRREQDYPIYAGVKLTNDFTPADFTFQTPDDSSIGAWPDVFSESDGYFAFAVPENTGDISGVRLFLNTVSSITFLEESNTPVILNGEPYKYWVSYFPLKTEFYSGGEFAVAQEYP